MWALSCPVGRSVRHRVHHSGSVSRDPSVSARAIFAASAAASSSFSRPSSMSSSRFSYASRWTPRKVRLISSASSGVKPPPSRPRSSSAARAAALRTSAPGDRYDRKLHVRNFRLPKMCNSRLPLTGRFAELQFRVCKRETQSRASHQWNLLR